MKFYQLLLSLNLLISTQLWAGAHQAPVGWDDFVFGLVNDGNQVYNDRMKAAIEDGIQLDYRYTYINNGVDFQADPNRNALSWLFTDWSDYAENSESRVAPGLRPAYVVYMLQEDQGNATLQRNANDSTFMSNFFESLKIAAEKSAGRKPIFVLEPDTWGYVIQAGIDPLSASARINNLGSQWSMLSDLDNNYAGLAQAMIRVVKTYAPDAYAGILMAHWAPHASECPAQNTPESNMGMPYWNLEDINCSVDRNIEFANQLLGEGNDRGDFIGVEKNGHSAGYWDRLENDADSRRYYWTDAHNANWVHWAKRLGEGVDLPVLGWQISIGHMGLRNSCEDGPLVPSGAAWNSASGNCAFEDTFFEYFFSHVNDFLDAGFIGILAGKGLGDDTDYTHANQDSQMGDGGWFFNQLKTFDQGRPYIQGGQAPLFNVQANSSQWQLLENQLKVSFDQATTVKIYSPTGQLMSQSIIQPGNQTWDLSSLSLAPGRYYIHSESETIMWVKP